MLTATISNLNLCYTKLSFKVLTFLTTRLHCYPSKFLDFGYYHCKLPDFDRHYSKLTLDCNYSKLMMLCYYSKLHDFECYYSKLHDIECYYSKLHDFECYCSKLHDIECYYVLLFQTT